MTEVQVHNGKMILLPSNRRVLSKEHPVSEVGVGFSVPKEPIYTSEFNVWLLIEEGWKFFLAEDGRVLGYRPPTLAERVGPRD